MTQSALARPAARLGVSDRTLGVLLAAAIVLAFAAILAGILVLNGGTFSYSHDDAYIELRLSENLYRLHYGINAAEPAAPSSSILYPIMLTPAAASRFHEFLPLAINLVCLVLTGSVAAAILRRSGLGAPAAHILAFVFLLAFDVVGVAFTGMEHSAHILVSLLVLLGLTVFFERGDPPAWLAPALVMGPLLRFEGLGVTVAALAVLLWQGRWRYVLSVGAVLALLLGGFVAAMISLGLPALPSSVLAKSQLAVGAAEGGRLGAVIRAILGNLKFVAAQPAQWLLALGGLLALRLWMPGATPLAPAVRGIAAFGVLAVAAHLMAGTYGSFGRYELYILSVGVLSLLFVWQGSLRQVLLAAPWRATVAISAAMIVVGLPYIRITKDTPAGANNIFLQQYQMHRFVADFFHGPVAVNDLGWVSYRNPDYVLDLWGLGSEEARKERGGGTRDWAERLTARRRIPLVMVFRSEFEGQAPKSWEPVAELKLHRKLVTAIIPTVTFFATPDADRPKLLEELDAFGETLPEGASLDILARR